MPLRLRVLSSRLRDGADGPTCFPSGPLAGLAYISDDSLFQILHDVP